LQLVWIGGVQKKKKKWEAGVDGKRKKKKRKARFDCPTERTKAKKKK